MVSFCSSFGLACFSLDQRFLRRALNSQVGHRTSLFAYKSRSLDKITTCFNLVVFINWGHQRRLKLTFLLFWLLNVIIWFVNQATLRKYRYLQGTKCLFRWRIHSIQVVFFHYIINYYRISSLVRHLWVVTNFILF